MERRSSRQAGATGVTRVPVDFGMNENDVDGQVCFPTATSARLRWRIRSGPVAEDRVEPLRFVFLVRRRKGRPERERVRRRAVHLQMGETLLGVSYGGNLTSWDPPQHQDRPLQRLEPLLACPQ